MRVLLRRSMGEEPIVLDDISQVVVLSEMDTPVSCAYHSVDNSTIIAAHTGEDDFHEHLKNVGSLAGVVVPLVRLDKLGR